VAKYPSNAGRFFTLSETAILPKFPVHFAVKELKFQYEDVRGTGNVST
jgi:hypothetical protein